MRIITLSVTFLLCVSLTHAQQRKIEKTITSNSFGSFGAAKTSAGAKERKSIPVDFKQSKQITPDGGKSTLVRFSSKTPKTPNEETPKRKLNSNATILVYPNPTNGEMTIKYFIPQNEEAEFAIYDLTGKKVATHQLTGERNQLIVSEKDLFEGIYFYNVISNGQIVKQDKIVIIK